MLRISSLVVMAATAMFSNEAFASNADECPYAEKISFHIQLTLKGTTLDKKSGVFIGTFEINNLSKNEPFTVRGISREHDGTIRVAHPDITIEYLDLLNQWRPLLNLPGSFFGTTEKTVVRPGKSLSFTASLMTPALASQNAREFRLLLRTTSPDRCVVSKPFSGLPSRPKVTSLISIGEEKDP